MKLDDGVHASGKVACLFPKALYSEGYMVYYLTRNVEYALYFHEL